MSKKYFLTPIRGCLNFRNVANLHKWLDQAHDELTRDVYFELIDELIELAGGEQYKPEMRKTLRRLIHDKISKIPRKELSPNDCDRCLKILKTIREQDALQKAEDEPPQLTVAEWEEESRLDRESSWKAVLEQEDGRELTAKRNSDPQHIETMHDDFLKSRGLKSNGVKSSKGALHRRVNHCYNCKNNLDSSLHLSCRTCNWIICPNCGACGCGYGEKAGHLF